MKLGKIVRNAIEKLYTDVLDAYRYETVENADGTTSEILSATPFLAAQPCRVSFVPNRQENPKDSDVDSNPILTQPKIFVAPDSGLKEGDYVVAHRLADDGVTVLAEYVGPIGLPFLYPSHLEVQIGVVDKA